MYPLTTAVLNLYKNEQRQVLRITGTDSNSNSISITDADIILDGFNVDRFILPNDVFEIGTACAAELNLKLNNASGAFDSIIFEGTELYVEIGIADWSQENPTIEYMPVGYFTPDEQPRRKSVISIKALDRMTRFDKEVDLTALSFPCTAWNLVNQICTLCNVSVSQTQEGTNWSTNITELPTLQQTYTYRDVIAWCAGLFAGFAFIDWAGELQFRGVKHTYLSNYSFSASNRFDSDVSENDITITGALCKYLNGTEQLVGTDDYILDLSNNFLVSQSPQWGYTLQFIFENIKGYSNYNVFRPFSATVVNAPYLWPLDRVRFYYGDNTNYYTCIITNVNFGINGTTEVAGKGQTKTLNNQASTGSMTASQLHTLGSMKYDSEFIIDDLPSLSGDPATGDELAIYSGSDTYKIDYNTLATAIISKLGDPVTVPHGGTGATTAAAALTNLGISPTDISGSWTKTSNTANGLTIELWVSSIIPRLVKLRISGATTVTLGTSSDYALLWTNSTVASLLSYDIVSYEMYTSIYAGQLNIRTDGTIHIGYTRNLATNAYENIPSGTNFYWEKVLLLV